ncbi:MAG: tyrosine-type recombinase/integrase [Myxococcales bacterium]|nr:tyrosine-type recombinase/integrase [Myxococcales bacterium]
MLLNQRGKPISAQGISNLVKRLAKVAEIPHVTLHQLRHSCASDLLESCASLPEVQRILGHACVATTMRYVDITAPGRATAIAKHPINGFLAFDEGMASWRAPNLPLGSKAI